MKIFISFLFVLFISTVLAIDCGKYVNPLTCAGQEPPCFWTGHKCSKILPRLNYCQKMIEVESCHSEKGSGCTWETESNSCKLSKFHCSSIKNEFDCTIENCVWSYKSNSCHA